MTRRCWDDTARVRVLAEEERSFGPAEWESSFDEGFPAWRSSVDLRFSRGRRQRRSLLPGADVFVASWVSQDVLDRGERLRWVHVTMSGIDGAEELEAPEGLKLTSAAGVAADGMAEHAFGLMVALDRRFDRALDRQRRWSWSQEGILGEVRGLRGRTAGIVGLGHSGRSLARLCAGAGMRVIGISRSGAPVEGVAEVWGPDGLTRLLRESDFAVLCAPATPETWQLIGSDELGQLGSASFLVNVARGELVDEAALGEALRSRTIAGAALDVLTQEPPPRRHPLRGAPNLIVTPHVAGNVHTFARAIRAGVVAQLRALAGV